ncbi:hypothetical protein SGRIM119S_03340 [Streptomyces griseorubiginosus]
MNPADSRSQTIISRRRSTRSTTTPAYGDSAAMTSVSAARTSAPHRGALVNSWSRARSGIIANQSPPRLTSWDR